MNVRVCPASSSQYWACSLFPQLVPLVCVRRYVSSTPHVSAHVASCCHYHHHHTTCVVHKHVTPSTTAVNMQRPDRPFLPLSMSEAPAKSPGCEVALPAITDVADARRCQLMSSCCICNGIIAMQHLACPWAELLDRFLDMRVLHCCCRPPHSPEESSRRTRLSCKHL